MMQVLKWLQKTRSVMLIYLVFVKVELLKPDFLPSVPYSRVAEASRTKSQDPSWRETMRFFGRYLTMFSVSTHHYLFNELLKSQFGRG